MDPWAEAADLKENPLPIYKLPEDDLLPTNIFMIDQEIASIQERLKCLQEERALLIDRAISVNILEDRYYRIEQKVRSIRIVNVPMFRATFPKEYGLICDLQRQEIEREFQHVGDKIPVGVADKFVPKKDSRDCMDLKETFSYAVVKKEVA